MHWSDIDLITRSLEELYAEEDIPEEDLPYLLEMILSINEFEDRELEVPDEHLERILEAWIELRNYK